MTVFANLLLTESKRPSVLQPATSLIVERVRERSSKMMESVNYMSYLTALETPVRLPRTRGASAKFEFLDQILFFGMIVLDQARAVTISPSLRAHFDAIVAIHEYIIAYACVWGGRRRSSRSCMPLRRAETFRPGRSSRSASIACSSSWLRCA